MSVKRAGHVVSTCKFQVDRCAAQFGSASLHCSNERASYAAVALISRDTQIAQPQAPFTRVGFKSAAEQGKAHYAISILGNKAFEPPVGTEATVQQQGCI